MARSRRRLPDVHGRSVRPARMLIAFQRVHLEPGEHRRLVVEVPSSMFRCGIRPTAGWSSQARSSSSSAVPPRMCDSARGDSHRRCRFRRSPTRALQHRAICRHRHRIRRTRHRRFRGGKCARLAERCEHGQRMVRAPAGRRLLKETMGGADEQTLDSQWRSPHQPDGDAQLAGDAQPGSVTPDLLSVLGWRGRMSPSPG